MFETESNAPIVNTFGDEYFHDVNGTAFNKVGSEALYKQHYAENLQQENALYIVLGTDSGLLPKYLQQVGLPEGTRYIFVELPEVLERLFAVTPIDGFDSRIILTTFEEWTQRAMEIEFQNYVFLGNMTFRRSIGAEDLHLDGYQECGRMLQEELEQLRWNLNAQMGSEIFNCRQLENLPENRVSAVCLEGTFAGKTAVILGGGPSLDQSLPWIIDNRECLVVIAVSRTVRRLMEIGLDPDIVVSIDPHQDSFDISKEALLLSDKTILVHQYHVSNKLLGQWPGRSFYLGHLFDWPTPWNDKQLVGRGPSVTNCALDLAVKMGFSRLLLTGVDLCFSKDGFTHAQGSNEHQAGPQLGLGQFWVETNAGTKAETTADFNFAIKMLADQARIATEQNCQFCNLAENAAKVTGVDFCALTTVDVKPLPKPAFEMLKDAFPEESAPLRIEHLNAMTTELKRAITTFKEIKQLAEEGLKANDTFFGRRGKGKGSAKYRNKLDKVEKKLKNNYPDFSRLIKRIGIKSFLKMTQGEQDKEKWDDAQIERLGRVYYESYRDSAKRLLEMVQDAHNRIRSRLEEEVPAPDFTLLLDQWEKDQQPGRALVWKKRHAEQTIPVEHLARFEQLAADFEQVINDTETYHMARSKAWSDLGPVCGKLKMMYRRGEQQSLQYLLTALEAMDRQDAVPLLHLGRGFLAELNKDADAAFEHYQQVINLLIEEQGGAVLEEALLRVFALSLERNDVENALLAGECLAGIAPVYLPYYADILRLAGDKMAALDVYADYLDQVKNDLTVMLKLGRLYLDLDIEDGAKLMFEAVLEQEPWNQAALHFLSQLDEQAG